MVVHMGGSQKYGPFLGTLNIKGRIKMGTQKGTIILTTTHIRIGSTSDDLDIPALHPLDTTVVNLLKPDHIAKNWMLSLVHIAYLLMTPSEALNCEL